jgi:hypothetical protein
MPADVSSPDSDRVWIFLLLVIGTARALERTSNLFDIQRPRPAIFILN